MNYKTIIAALAALPLLASCFKSEPLNAECDIEQAYIHVGNKIDVWFENPSDTLRFVQHALKGQKHIAQGSALGKPGIQQCALKGQKRYGN